MVIFQAFARFFHLFFDTGNGGSRFCSSGPFSGDNTL
jgi:hypothetical protein